MKVCAICSASQPKDAETCSECGEGSWHPAEAPADVTPPAADADTGAAQVEMPSMGRKKAKG